MTTINEKKQRVLELDGKHQPIQGVIMRPEEIEYFSAMPDAVEVIRHQDAEIKRLRGILNLVHVTCENLHHAKMHRHSALEDCPVVREFNQALAETEE